MPSVAPGTDAGASDVLLERAAELSLLVDCLEAVERRSRGQVLLVGGEAGVGKTTLVRRFCEARGQSARILWGACDPLFAPSPLGPLLDVAEETGGELEAVVARGAMPYQVVTALARELGARSPTVLVLEDVHWADEATLDVLRLLARRVEAVPALVVASYRDDALDREHPLRVMLGELARSRTVRRMKLARLSLEAVAQLAEPYGVDAGDLYRKTAGNPFFVIEALAAGAEGIPETVRDAVLARAARLSSAGAAVLEAVAVVPPQAELWLLEAVAGAAAGQLDECLSSGMLIFESAGVSRESAPDVTDYGPAEDRGAQLDGYVVIFTSIREDWDLTPVCSRGCRATAARARTGAMSRRGASPSATATVKRSLSRATRSTCHRGMFPRRWREPSW